MQGRETFRKMRWLINLTTAFFKMFPVSFRIRVFYAFRKWSGKVGIGLRYCALKSVAKQCGDNVAIFENVFILNPQNMCLGSNISIQPMCYIENGEKGITIGNDVSIAHNVTIMATSHDFTDLHIAIKNQKMIHKAVIIHDNVWVGAKVTILYGVTLHSGSIVGANSLVNKDVDEYTIVGGIPCKVIKERE